MEFGERIEFLEIVRGRREVREYRKVQKKEEFINPLCASATRRGFYAKGSSMTQNSRKAENRWFISRGRILTAFLTRSKERSSSRDVH
jgi:hypothetical protein